jgi:hypothetical protein
VNTELEGDAKTGPNVFDSISQKLASLDGEFNTMKGFGLQGLMDQAKEKEEANEVAQKVIVTDVTEPKSIPDNYAPLNTSIQKLREDTQSELGRIANKIEQIAVTPRQQVTGEGQELTFEQRRIQELESRQATSELRNEWYRAKSALDRARSANPDFTYTENDLTAEWNKYIGSNVAVAAQADWDHFLKTKYMESKAPEWRRDSEEVKTLREEVAKLKNNRNTVADVMSMPRAAKNIVTSKAKDEKSMAIDEDVYQKVRLKFPKGRFIGITKYADEVQQRKSA